ncbi:helix-turn-helix domain-containing protein [Alicyclobacillus tolerans]|uniref:helix-turn-helix domain-containing protein n=1 Tax=Alicyclobacillus TaxID=29330 RepID=UPI001932CA07|nr:helix-turn-helix domain-containing protein [Alicyclobacillus sp. TC]
MRKAYKYRLYPAKEQEEKIQLTLERCRLLYNRLLDERRFAYETDKTTLNYYDQANTLNERKKYIPALKQVHSQVLQDVVKRLDKAFQAFFRRVKWNPIPCLSPKKQLGSILV